MAFDTVIDKTLLEGALTATANAIRSKTGSKGNITWDSSKGFADAVSSMPMNVRTISFDTWHNGASEQTLLSFEHGLGVKPRFVAIISDDVEAVKRATLPDGIAASIIQSDRLYNSATGEMYPPSYVRYLNGEIGVASFNTSYRLISGWDERCVYVNSAGATYAWCPSDVTTYTMICVV